MSPHYLMTFLIVVVPVWVLIAALSLGLNVRAPIPSPNGVRVEKKGAPSRSPLRTVEPPQRDRLERRSLAPRWSRKARVIWEREIARLSAGSRTTT